MHGTLILLLSTMLPWFGVLVLGVTAFFNMIAAFIAYLFVLTFLKDTEAPLLSSISILLVFAMGILIASSVVPVRCAFDLANSVHIFSTFVFSLAAYSNFLGSSFAFVTASILMASMVKKIDAFTTRTMVRQSRQLNFTKALFFLLLVVMPVCVLAPATSTSHSGFLGADIEADPVAMMLNFVVVNGLLPRDHIQYLALKYQLEIAVGVRPPTSPMTGEFLPLRSFNESIMQYASRTVIHLLRGPHQQRAGNKGVDTSAVGQQGLSLVNLFGFMDPRHISLGKLNASKQIGFDFSAVARLIWSSANIPASGIAILNVAEDAITKRPVACHLFGYNEDGTVIASGLDASLPDGDIWGLEDGPILFEELGALEQDDKELRARLAPKNFAKEAVEVNLTRLDNLTHGFVEIRFNSGFGG